MHVMANGSYRHNGQELTASEVLAKMEEKAPRQHSDQDDSKVRSNEPSGRKVGKAKKQGSASAA